MRNAIADVQQIPNTSDVQMKAVDLMNPETFHCEEEINCSKRARKGWNPCLSGLFDLRYDWVSRSESAATLSFGKTWRRRPRFAILLTVHLQYFTALCNTSSIHWGCHLVICKDMKACRDLLDVVTGKVKLAKEWRSSLTFNWCYVHFEPTYLF